MPTGCDHSNRLKGVIDRMNRYSASSAIPRAHRPTRRARRRPLVELALPGARRVPRARLSALATHGPQPGPHAEARPAPSGSRRRRGPVVPDALRRGRPRARLGALGAPTPGGASRSVTGRAASGGVLLRRVRAAPVAADLRRRARRAGGRHLQGGERPRHPGGGRRVHVPAGLLPPARDRRRLAAGGVRAARLDLHRHGAGPPSRTAPPASSRCRSATGPCSSAVWTVRAGRVRLLPARHRHRRRTPRGTAS